jgi:hypothetical protein
MSILTSFRGFEAASLISPARIEDVPAAMADPEVEKEVIRKKLANPSAILRTN